MIRSLPIAVLLWMLVAQQTLAQPNPSATTDNASRRVMEHWVGDWTGGVAGAAHVAALHIAATPDYAKVEWTLNDHFLRGTNYGKDDKPVGVWLMRYSPKTRTYQVWFFTSASDATMWNGTWDDTKQAMSWKTTNPETGATGTGHTRFVDGRQEWTLRVTQDGKTSESSGSLQRK